MNIIEATKEAMIQGKGIINDEFESMGFYLLPTNNRECYILIRIGAHGYNIGSPKWNPKASDILRDDWRLTE